MSVHGNREPAAAASPWIVRWLHLIPAGGRVLDVACGGGRHARLCLAHGHTVVGVDRDLSGVADLGGEARFAAIAADLEGPRWPLDDARFDGVIVANYLFRERLAALVAAVAPGGALLYETFAAGNERYGRPRNPDYLLQRDELVDALRPELAIVAFEQGRVHDATGACRVVQRIAAVRGLAWLDLIGPG